MDTADYAVNRFSGEAVRTLLQRHPADGRIMVRRIGSEPEFGASPKGIAGRVRAELLLSGGWPPR